MNDFKDVGGGWLLRKDVSHLVQNKRLRKENKKLKDQLQALEGRLEALEKKVE